MLHLRHQLTSMYLSRASTKKHSQSWSARDDGLLSCCCWQMQVELQQFAWTEAEHRQVAEQATGCPSASCKHVRFCFETALKALFLSYAVYRTDEVGLTMSHAPAK